MTSDIIHWQDLPEYNAGEVFSGRKSGTTFRGYDLPYNPRKDYVAPTWAQMFVIWLVRQKYDADGNMVMSDPVWLFGPTGCGKTLTVRELCARARLPLYEATGRANLEFADLVGGVRVANGSTYYEYGPLAKAVKYGGVFLLNEFDILDPAVAAGLNSVLDGNELMIPENGGEVIKTHPMFKFIATANSGGKGDSTGQYQGVVMQNIATLDRYVYIKADYMDAVQETNMLSSKYPDLPSEVVRRMVELAGMIRHLFMGENLGENEYPLDITMSTRSLCQWAEWASYLKPMSGKRNPDGSLVDVIGMALDTTLLAPASPATRATVLELKQRVFG